MGIVDLRDRAPDLDVVEVLHVRPFALGRAGDDRDEFVSLPEHRDLIPSIRALDGPADVLPREACA